MSARPTAAEQARRLLVLLPHLRGQGSRSLSDLAAATRTDEVTVADDLTKLSMCGTDDRDPNALVGVLVDGDEAIVFGVLPALGEPVRLTSSEARALLAALDACAVGPESSLIERLTAMTQTTTDPDSLTRSVRASVAPDGVAHTLARLGSLASACATARMTYTSQGSAQTSERVVRPLRCLYSRGAWYLIAWDEGVREQRTFRLDRISAVEPTGDHFVRPEGQIAATDVAPDPAALPRADVIFRQDVPDLTPREWPGAEFERQVDGSVMASVPFAGTRWISRRIASRLGDAMVVGPADVRAAVAEVAREELG